ncbi:MAG: GNAT family N-acetyltransferase [Woeseiaceae bacterium]
MLVTIVPAVRAHLGAIPRIEQAAAALFPDADLPAGLRYLVTDRETLEDALRERRLWVAEDRRHHAVGFALACVIDGVAHLDEMDVHPRHGRQGIGVRLLQAVCDWAVLLGHDALTLVTFRHLPWNAPYYARLGFTPVPAGEIGPEMRELLREESDAGLDGTKRIVMRRSLP